MHFKNILLLTFVFILAGCNLGGEGTKKERGYGAPYLYDIGDVTTNEDTARTVILRAADLRDGDTITYAATSSTANVKIGISGATLTLTPAANWNGTAIINALVNDGIRSSLRRTFTLTVRAVNDAPVLASISNQTTNEATAKSVTLVGSDVDGREFTSDVLTYSATSSNSDVVITVDNKTLTLTPNSDWNGSATITAKVNDGTADSAEQTFTLTVNAFVSGGTFKGKVYETVTSPDTGRVWLDRNLGADQKCTSMTDPDCYGYHYQWGRDDDGHELTSSTVIATLATVITPAINSFITNNTAPKDWTSADTVGSLREAAWENAGVNDICPAGYSVPTFAQIEADTTDAIETAITNSATAFSSFLKLPVGGFVSGVSGGILHAGIQGSIHSRTYIDNNSSFFWFDPGSMGADSTFRNNGISVRCIKDL